MVDEQVSHAPLGEIKWAIIFVPTAPGDDELRGIPFVLVAKGLSGHATWSLWAQLEFSAAIAFDSELDGSNAKGKEIEPGILARCFILLCDELESE